MHQAFEGFEPRSNRGSGVARPPLLHCKRPGAWGAMQEEITFRGGRDANLARRSATTSSSALLPFFGIFSSNVHPLISSAKKTPRRAKSFRPDPKTHTRASGKKCLLSRCEPQEHGSPRGRATHGGSSTAKALWKGHSPCRWPHLRCSPQPQPQTTTQKYWKLTPATFEGASGRGGSPVQRTPLRARGTSAGVYLSPGRDGVRWSSSHASRCAILGGGA